MRVEDCEYEENSSWQFLHVKDFLRVNWNKALGYEVVNDSTVPERQRNTHLLQRNTNKKITEHSLFSSTYSYISSSINCFSNSWCISRGMWIKNIFIHLYHQSKSIYGDQGLRNNSLKLRYDFLCFCAKKRNTRQWVFR